MTDFMYAFTSFAVSDIDAARTFYRDVVGLTVTDESMGQIAIDLPGDNWVLLYPKPNFVPATYTVLNLVVDDIEVAVDALAARGVEFVRYDGFEQDARGIARGIATNEGPDIAWFTDPAGNILSVLQNAD